MKFDAYEYTGVILPGSVVVFALTLLFPEVKDLLGKDGVSVGGLGVFVVASFVVGHIVQALGNIIERLGDSVYGPGRSNALLSPTQTLISADQRDRLKVTLFDRLGIRLDTMSSADWQSTRREMYAGVRAAKASDRIDAFNRTYGLLRGIAAGFVCASCVTIASAPFRWPAAVALAIGAGLALLRMRRFSDHYTQELVVEYLRLNAKIENVAGISQVDGRRENINAKDQSRRRKPGGSPPVA